MYSTNRNLYVKTSKPTFAYQSIGGTNQANQQLFFVPPINCSTPKTVNNIPYIEKIGSRNFITNSGLNIVTGLNANLQLSINGVIYPITSLPLGIIASTANSVTGNINFETYTITGLTGNIGVFSNKQVYVSFFGTNGAATYGGYYSGFDLKPELSVDNSTSISGNCIPNVVLKTEPDSDYTYQWLNNGIAINGETENTFKPLSPGYYQVKRSIPSCNTSTLSDKIPVSNCPTDNDIDSVPDDIDLDYDNDGVTNCVESFGNSVVDLTDTRINKNTYFNTYSTNITYVPATSSVLLSAKSNGDFISEVPVGVNNATEYTITFTNPISLALEYVATGNSTDLINSEGEFIVKSHSNKTVTVLNPTNQLLIDTNYDGIYESGVTQHSSFEIRFRLNSTTPLAAGTGTFSFQSFLTTSLTFIHKNLSETANNKASFSIKAKCIPRDSDLDLVPDYLDIDSDNDGILDIIESQANTLVGTSATDANKNGIHDVFGTGTIPQDSDQDGIADYLDLDSDNDGIKDELETDQDQDNDGIRNYRDLDRENDGCNDVIEAGFNDGDADGKFGISPVLVNDKGLVNSVPYSVPNADYSIAAPIIIDNLAAVSPVCDKQNIIIVVNGNSGISFQWQKSIDELNWFDISDNAIFSGSNTNSLKISDVNPTMSGEFYRVKMSKSGNSCGRISNTTKLLVNPLPTVNSSIDLVQCIENTNMLFSTFNLTEKNNFISTNYNLETFTYFRNYLGAELNDADELISNSIAYPSVSKTIGVRIENSNGCVNFSTLNLILSSTKIPNNFEKPFEVCDDGPDDADGIGSFNIQSIEDEIKQFLIPPFTNYDIKCYENEENALAEKKEIKNISNFQNQNSPNLQFIWVRVDNKIDNSCYALGRHIKLIVNPKPNIDTNKEGKDDQLVCLNLPNLFVELTAGLQNEASSTLFNYNWTKDGNEITNATNPILNVNQEGIYTVKVNTPKGCFRNRIVKVTSSDIAKIENIDIVDLSTNNSVTITTSGKGNYEFSLDNEFGPFQKSNFFDQVSAGIHDVYIIDTKGCGTVKKTIAVVGVPKFFTPNQDGFNDFWNIKGIDTTFNSKSIIYIFDRYGKLLKQMLPSSLGWDGTLNGAPLPSDDYWFTLELEDGREVKGHFSLKR
jgi:gliding motility-associated-like protein